MINAGKLSWLLVLTMCLYCTGLAWGQTPAGEKASSLPSFDSVGKLNSFFDQRLEEARLAIEKERLAALSDYLGKASGAEHAEVLIMMMESAMILEDYGQTLGLSDTYFKEHGRHSGIWSVRGMRWAALVRKDRLGQASKEWEAAVESFEKEELQAVFGTGMQIAEGYLDKLNTEGARKIYDKLAQKLSFAGDIQQVLRPHRNALSWIGKKAPELKGKTLDGKELGLADYKGKIVLIDFWASWCPPCLASLPELEEVYRNYHHQGFEVIGVSLDHSEEMLAQYLNKNPLPWMNIYDGYFDGPNARRYEVEGIPQSFVLDRKGRIVRANKPAMGYASLIEKLVSQSGSSSE